MSNNGEEIIKLYKNFKKHNLYQIKTEINGEKYNELVANSRFKNLWFWFGKKSLGNFKDRTLNNLITNFLTKKFEEEKLNKEFCKCDHLNIRVLYRKKIFLNYLKVGIAFYLLPFMYLFSSNIRKFGAVRFLIFLPFLFSFGSFIDMVNEYNLKKNSSLFLFAIENTYDKDCPHKIIYNDYKEFAKQNNLVFINEKDENNKKI